MRLLTILILVAAASTIAAQNPQDAVKDVITSAYIKGIHNGGPIEDIRKGFHPSFNMLRLVDNEVSPLPIEDWITNIEKNRANQTGTPPTTEGKFIRVDVAGNSASVMLELYRGDKKIFTDHLLLYQFNEGWRIVSKTYYRHP